MRIAVLGGGPGGYVAALKAARLGAQVSLIESDELGGTCLNWGCIPTKALLSSADALRTARRLSEFGIDLAGSPSPDIAKIMERKNRIVSNLVKGIKGLLKTWGVTLIEARGTLTGPRTIAALKRDGSQETIEAERIIIATGSRPADIPLFPFNGKEILSSNDAVHIREIPGSILIVGAGVIGCEFACILRELGTDVTIVEILPRAVATEDIEISELLARELKKKQIKLLTGVSVATVEARADGIHSILSDGGEIVTEKILVSVGRKLKSDAIGLETVGIQKGPKGEILVNERMETNVEGVYAVGDVVGGMLLAHVASRQGIVAAQNACGRQRSMDYAVIPAAIFTSPEIASVGWREFQAVDSGLKIRTGRFLFRGLGKAHVMGEIEGFIKVISDAHTDRVIGVHVIGPHASDLIHEAALAMKAGLTVKQITETVHAHPTLSEGILEAAEDVHGDAIHLPRK